MKRASSVSEMSWQKLDIAIVVKEQAAILRSHYFQVRSHQRNWMPGKVFDRNIGKTHKYRCVKSVCIRSYSGPNAGKYGPE